MPHLHINSGYLVECIFQNILECSCGFGFRCRQSLDLPTFWPNGWGYGEAQVKTLEFQVGWLSFKRADTTHSMTHLGVETIGYSIGQLSGHRTFVGEILGKENGDLNWPDRVKNFLQKFYIKLTSINQMTFPPKS